MVYYKTGQTEYKMFPSKSHKTLILISNYLVLHPNISAFVQECTVLYISFKHDDVSSDKFQKSVIRVFEICKDIGIAQLLPSILYEQVMNAYFIYNHNKTIINELTGMEFVDNTVAG